MKISTKVLDDRLGTEWPLPRYASDGSAGLDLRAMLNEPLSLHAGKTIMIPTGIAIHINTPGVAGLVIPRSGLAHRYGLVLSNLVGLIDSDYQGELKLSMWNTSDNIVRINPGDRVAQMILIPVHFCELEVVNEFVPTMRGDGGFGSSGCGN